MKSIFRISVLALVIVLGTSLRNTASAQYDQNDQYDQDRDVSYQTFYDELSPHGRWIDYPGQGYVWVPDAGPDFRPYSTNGHWVWTEDYEWMWVSDYDWGWAPFHYGRWDQDPAYGWYWVPGYEWSSAWVAWRDGGDYYGWAPIRPGIQISINFNIGGYSPPNDFWCFAPRRYITSPRLYDYCVDRRQNVTIINYTTVIVNNYRYNNNYGFRSGPRRYDAERYCGRINPVRFRETYRPGRSEFRNNEVSIYRPNVRRDDNRSFSPRTVERYDRNNNTGFRRNDNNNGNNNNTADRRQFEKRDDNTRQQNSNGNNNTADRRQFERRNNEVKPQDNNGNTNTPPDRRRIERNDNNRNDQPNRDAERRVIKPSERPERTPNSNNNNGNNDSRKFERRDNNNGSTPVRQPQQIERRQEPRPQQQVERRQEPRQQQPQQPTERRQQPQQMERRQEQRQQPQQQQPTRQFERKENNNGNGNGNGNGSGKRRF